MKSFIVFVALFVVSAYGFTEEQLAKGNAYATACAKEHGVEAAAVEKLKGGDFSNDDKKLQCFTSCFFEKAGFLKDGQLQEAATIEKLSTTGDRAKVEKLVATCKGVSGADNCETAFKIFKCYHDNK